VTPPEKTHTPNSFKRSSNPGRIIRSWLILARLEKKRQSNKKSATRRGLSGVALGLVSVAVVVAFMTAGFYASAILADLPDVAELEKLAGPGGRLFQPTLFFDRSGQNLIPGNTGNVNLPVYYDFMDTSGTDGAGQLPGLVAFLSASPDSELDGRITETPAERLVSDLLLGGETPSYVHTLRVKLLAAQAIGRFGQTRILDWYLNTAEFGHAILGAGQAAEIYFHKTPDQLNGGEALILATILLEPAVNPIDTPEVFEEALQLTGSRLIGKGGDETIMQQARDALEDLKVSPPEQTTDNPAFFNIVREQFSRDARIKQPDLGGLSVFTTLDIELQSRLECALFELLGSTQTGLDCGRALSGVHTPLSPIAATEGLRVNFVVLDPANGQVLAMLGDYSNESGEQAYLQPHPGGSLVTPFIYLTGMLQGMSPATLVWDTPTGLDADAPGFSAAVTEFQGPMSLRTALSGDHLAPAAKMLLDFGQENVTALMAGFGLQLYASEGIPYTSGIADSLSVAQAYGVFANSGIKTGIIPERQAGVLAPNTILRAVDSDDQALVEQRDYQEQILINPALAFLVNDMLANEKDVPGSFPGSTKTGVTTDGADYWRVAYTPDYVFVMWLGYSDPDGKPRLRDLGIDLALISVLVGDAFPADTRFDGWKVPEGVSRLEVCMPSGRLPGDACPQTVSEYFLMGTEPTETDNLYVEYPIDMETGRLATVFTNPAHITRQVFFNPPAEELDWVRDAGYPLAPGNYDIFQPGSISSGTVILDPLNFDSVSGKIVIRGEVTPVGFVSYRLDVGAGLAPTQWLQVGNALTDLPQGQILGTVDTARFEDGLYTLRVQVLRQGNIVDNSFVVILITNSTEKK
jgi:membrane peptidoglycan carboxypeptidase